MDNRNYRTLRFHLKKLNRIPDIAFQLASTLHNEDNFSQD